MRRWLLAGAILLVAGWAAHSSSLTSGGVGGGSGVATAAAAAPAGGGAAAVPPERAWVAYLPELVVCLSFGVAGFVQGVSGFAAGMVSMAIMPLAMDMIDVVPIVAIFCGATNLTILVQLRDSLDEQVLGALPMLIFGQFGGVPLGVLLLQHADPEWLRILLGITMLGFVAHEWHHKLEVHLPCGGDDGGDRGGGGGGAVDQAAAEEGQPLLAATPVAKVELELELESFDVDSPKKAKAAAAAATAGAAAGDDGGDGGGQIASWWGLPFGLLAGILNGALNEGGPPVVVFFALRRWDKDRVKVALQAFFVSLSATTIVAQLAHGLIQPRHLYFDLVGFPAAALGIGGGTAIYNRFDTKGFSDVVVSSLLVTGVLFIYHSTANLTEKHGTFGGAVHVAFDHISNASAAVMTRSSGAEH